LRVVVPADYYRYMAGMLRSAVRIACVVVTIAFLVSPVSAQTDADESQVFAPFVSRLRVSVRDPQIRLSWIDAEDVDGPYLIYRHTAPLTADNIEEATFVASVDGGVESYIDTPETTGSFFYAVLAQMEELVPYPIYIPGRNATYNSVTIASTTPIDERTAEISSITTAVATSNGLPAIEVSFQADRDDRTVIVYRSTSPFEDAEDLQHGSVVREVSSSVGVVIDLPVPGVAYYYAAADTEAILAGTVRLVAGRNVTETATEIPLDVLSAGGTTAAVTGPEAETLSVEEATEAQAGEPGEEAEEPSETAQLPGSTPRLATAMQVTIPEAPEEIEPVIDLQPSRPMPLPFLRLQSEVASGDHLATTESEIPSRIEPLSEEAATKVERLLASLEPIESRRIDPALLDIDTFPDPEGVEYTLRTILEGPFADEMWQDTLDQLGYYFALPLTPELRARGHFYRAQAYYFLGQEQLAFAEFLLARDYFYVEVGPWLSAILDESSGA
jgi:hypothetical protein